MTTEILCIGSALWDLIGRAPGRMAPGADLPGRILRVPGGVALNVAFGLVRLGLSPRLLSAIGRDSDGETLMEEVARRGIDVSLVHRPDDLPTDRYMAIECADGLMAAIADARSLEVTGRAILDPLVDGRLARPDAPFEGLAFLDGNLPMPLMAEIVDRAWLTAADLRIAPASPGKAERLSPCLDLPRATIYLNRQEAGLLLGAEQPDAPGAARALAAESRARIVVTDGARPAAISTFSRATVTATPPKVSEERRVTGAGDMFVAAHIAAERAGRGDNDALSDALAAAARHVSGEDT